MPRPHPTVPARRIEVALGTTILLLPLLYLLTEHSKTVWFWRWSAEWCALIAGYGTVLLAYVISYSVTLPRLVERTRRAIVIMGTSGTAALLCLEIGLHVTDDAIYKPLANVGRHAYDPDVGHVFQRNFSQTLQSREFRTEWRSNAQGVRADRDFGPKPEGVRRILAVGDSFTVGEQVALRDTWPGVLQHQLDEKFGVGRVEVVNGGFPGYGTVHELGWLKKFGAQFEPDVVVCAVTPNDLMENMSPILYIARDGGLVNPATDEGTIRLWQEREKWYSVPGLVHGSMIMRRINALGWRDSEYLHRLAFMVEPDDAAKWQRHVMLEALRSMREEAGRLGARFAVAVIPFREQLTGLGEGLDPTVFGQHIAEAGFQTLDLLEAFRSAEDTQALYWKEDSHCTAAGYHVVGSAVTRFLLDLGDGWLPRR